jgi:putative flavoprotein involved in K+ transport
MTATVDVVVIGGGQAGLATSAQLRRWGIEHVILERESIASRWRRRWDSFTLVTPNWQIRLPDGEYEGRDPDGFLPRDEVVAHLERYADRIEAPVRLGVTVSEVVAHDGGYRVTTDDGPLDARNVVVAVGTHQTPRRPRLGRLDPGILELHTADYRNPGALPPGGVLVIGSGQSGMQIAEDLMLAGRPVVLSVGKTGRLPRRYRGRDIFRWAEFIGFYERTPDMLESPAERFSSNPAVSGARGGHTVNLHRFARDGARLTGKIAAMDGHRVTFADDLHANLAFADAVAGGFRQLIDQRIAERGESAPEPDPSNTDEHDGTEGFDQPGFAELDLRREGIASVLWASGFAWDFSWVRPAALDAFGYPIQRQGVTDSPGLYFVGLHFLHRFKSGLLLGVGEDAGHVADSIATRIGATAGS